MGREALKATFAPLESRVAGVFLWGSHAAGTATARSDVDICIVAGPGRAALDALEAALALPGLGDLPYDVRGFEELPLYLKAAVLERGALLVARDPPALYEYLRRWAKEWADQAHRNRPTHDALDRVFAARRARRAEPGRGGAP